MKYGKKQKEDPLPGYLRWRHLASSAGRSPLPQSVSFLLRIISVTDAVISFNNAKRLTNELGAVCRVVSHVCKGSVAAEHYRKILLVFGGVYRYRKSDAIREDAVIIERTEIENKLMCCEEKATRWIREEYLRNTRIEPRDMQPEEIDELIEQDKEFQNSLFENRELPELVERQIEKDIEEEIEMKEITECRDIRAGGAGAGRGLDDDLSAAKSVRTRSSTEIAGDKDEKPRGTAETRSKEVKLRARTRTEEIFERIRAKEAQRRRDFIRMEEEKEREIGQAFKVIYLLCVSEDKKSFEKSLLQKRIPLLNRGTITIDDITGHPEYKNYINTKDFEGLTYLVIDIEKYRNSKNFEQ